MVILDPVRSEEQNLETLDQIDEVVKKWGGTPDSRDVWGKRRLAYQIERRKEGWYAVMLFDGESNGELLAELDRYLKFNEDIIRHLVTEAVVGKSKGDLSLLRDERLVSRFGGGPSASRRAPTEESPEQKTGEPAKEEAPEAPSAEETKPAETPAEG